ncbi:unnamed protein product [Mesocestoides corti]|uniref:Expressed conserved protein n=1 Tax=Mesocestoides corti TaxID=53468 RepID=A0A0R3U9X7_MESCO|nr:unnamed protein product [Mesocestoides corti]
MHLRKLTAALLALACLALVISLSLPYWKCGNLFEKCIEEGSENLHEMMAVGALLAIGLVLLFLAFLLDVLLLCRSQALPGTITARFLFIYLGAATTFTAVVLYTFFELGQWGYFLAIVGATIAFVVQKLAMMSSRCVTTDA